MNADISKVLAIVSIAGFAIQQAIQLCDIWISKWVQARKKTDPTLGGLSDGDYKKSLISWISFFLGLCTVGYTRIRILKDVGVGGAPWTWADVGEIVVTSLVVGAGTEGMNTLLKYFGYVKDARGAMTSGDITIMPAALTLKPGASFQFLYKVANPENALVEWSIPQGASGGTITQTGLYTAPGTPGTFQVLVTSKSDPTRAAVASVTVTP